MKFLTSLLALARLTLLRRHWRHIRALLNSLPHGKRSVLAAMIYGESQRAANHPTPRFYASTSVNAYAPWGDAAETSFEKMRNSHEQVRFRGLSTWIAVVFHETRDSTFSGMRQQHEEVARELGNYRELHERALALRMAA